MISPVTCILMFVSRFEHVTVLRPASVGTSLVSCPARALCTSGRLRDSAAPALSVQGISSVRGIFSGAFVAGAPARLFSWASGQRLAWFIIT